MKSDFDIEAICGRIGNLRATVACEQCGEQRTPEQCDHCDRLARARANAEARLLAAVPRKYHWASFDAAELSMRVKDSNAIAKAKGLLEAPMVTLTGNAGAGKTVLATCMLRWRMAERRSRHPAFAFAADIATARQQAKLGEGEAAAVANALEADALVLDDLGQEADTLWSKALVEVIHHRHANELTTYVTTGLDPKAVASRYGDGCARRLFEGGYLALKGGRS